MTLDDPGFPEEREYNCASAQVFENHCCSLLGSLDLRCHAQNSFDRVNDHFRG